MYILTQSKNGVLNSKKISGIYIQEELKDCTYIAAKADNFLKPVILGEYKNVETAKKVFEKIRRSLGYELMYEKDIDIRQIPEIDMPEDNADDLRKFGIVID